jgi:hypothetical protein
MSVERVVFTLADKFPEYDWDIYQTDINNGMYCILVNDYDFYRSKKYRKWCDLLRKKYPKVRWFSAYKKFKH